MAAYFFVTPGKTPGATASSPPCASIDDALRGAKFLLGNGAASVWIVDRDGNLVLPAEQVKVRLEPPGPALSGVAAS